MFYFNKLLGNFWSRKAKMWPCQRNSVNYATFPLQLKIFSGFSFEDRRSPQGHGVIVGTNAGTKFTTFNPEQQSRFSFPLLTRTSATFLPSSYQQSIWFEQQAVIQIKRGSCLCSSCGRPLCGGCDLTRGSCWPPFCVGPVMSPGFVLGLWVGPPHYWNAPVENWKRRMKGSQQRCWWTHQVNL